MTDAYTLSMRFVVSAAVLSLCLAATTVTARVFHFELVKSSPTTGQKLDAAPARVQLWFSQVPAAGVSTMSIKQGDADVAAGKPVIVASDKSMYIEPSKPLAAGDYLVKWRGAGDDGHVSTGEVKFTIVAK